MLIFTKRLQIAAWICQRKHQSKQKCLVFIVFSHKKKKKGKKWMVRGGEKFIRLDSEGRILKNYKKIIMVTLIIVKVLIVIITIVTTILFI